MDASREHGGRLGRAVTFTGIGCLVVAGLFLAGAFSPLSTWGPGSGPDGNLGWLFPALFLGVLGTVLLLLSALGSVGRFLRRHGARSILVRMSLTLMAVGVACAIAAFVIAGYNTDNARAVGFVAAAIAGSGMVLYILVALATALQSIGHHGGHAPAA